MTHGMTYNESEQQPKMRIGWLLLQAQARWQSQSQVDWFEEEVEGKAENGQSRVLLPTPAR
jgi:hypothetical protein